MARVVHLSKLISGTLKNWFYYYIDDLFIGYCKGSLNEFGVILKEGVYFELLPRWDDFLLEFLESLFLALELLFEPLLWVSFPIFSYSFGLF
jgi:hypothetical protein